MKQKTLSYRAFHKMVFPFFGTLKLTVTLNLEKEYLLFPLFVWKQKRQSIAYACKDLNFTSIYPTPPTFRMIRWSTILVAHLCSKDHRNYKDSGGDYTIITKSGGSNACVLP